MAGRDDGWKSWNPQCICQGSSKRHRMIDRGNKKYDNRLRLSYRMALIYLSGFFSAAYGWKSSRFFPGMSLLYHEMCIRDSLYSFLYHLLDFIPLDLITSTALDERLDIAIPSGTGKAEYAERQIHQKRIQRPFPGQPIVNPSVWTQWKPSIGPIRA